MTVEELIAAGIKPRHIQNVMQISRVTASNWLRGTSHPHHLLTERYEEFCGAVQAAVDAGELPVATEFSTMEADMRVVSVLKKHLRDLKC